MQILLPPSPASAHAARVAVSEFLVSLGRADLVDDVLLVATELVVNAVMHARTEMSLSVERAGGGVKVAVTDGSNVLPGWAPSSPTATSGRGLLLVVRLSHSWGVDPMPTGGKRVWAELDAAARDPDPSGPDDLLDLWSEEPWPARPTSATSVEIDLDVDVQAMLHSRAHTEDLVRELQLTLLRMNTDMDTDADEVDAGSASAAQAAIVGLARRLDAANQDFHEARRQIFSQTVGAAKRRQSQVTLHLRLHPSDVARARRWIAALDEADELTSAGILLLPPFPPDMTAFRRKYIGSIIEELTVSA